LRKAVGRIKDSCDKGRGAVPPGAQACPAPGITGRTIEPIGAAQQAEVRRETQYYVDLAAELLARPFRPVPVSFDLRGTTAGMFKIEGRARWIRYNPWIFAKYYTENLRDTVPHEVAHYIVHEFYGRRRIKPHGPEWRALMEAFGADPGVTFKLDISDLPQRRQRTHAYLCLCREHEVSTTRHNRIERGVIYQCRYCDGHLEYAG
jgi:SprT protein